MGQPRGTSFGLIAVALTTSMGVHALRGFLAMIVWNIAVERPAFVLGGIALIVYAAGLAGFLKPRVESAGMRNGRAVAFALLYAAGHYIRYPILTPALALAAAVAWLWFFPALIARLSRAGHIDALSSGLSLGIAAQLALQTALHGLDLPMLQGILPGLGATALAAALLVCWRGLDAERGSQPASGPRLPGWGLIAFGPYLTLQLVLLANVGRAEMLTGLRLPLASVPALLGLAAGAAGVAYFASPPIGRIAAAAGVLILLQPAWLDRYGVTLLLIAQIALSITLAEALRAAEVRSPSSTYAGGAAGLLLAFAAIFLYYSRYEWPALWPVLAALVALPAVVGRAAPRPRPSMTPVFVMVVVGALGVALGAIPARSAAQTVIHPPDELRVFDYNIHMGFDAEGLPDPQGIARVLDDADADVIALQEVGRGWTVNGGADLFAWLRWRFPRYRAVYGPMNGALWGNAILSRVPVNGQGSLRFPVRESKFQRGLTWVTLPAPRGELLVIATHFANEAAAEDDRLAQAGDLLAFWQSRPRTIIMGDFNAEPDSAPITRVLASGPRDALAPHGLRMAGTYPSPSPAIRIDYVFATADIEPVAAAIPQTTASDHRPLAVRLRVP
ncbi:MAG TPA: endonuclease/exonuclease/phosphatase family protein [bacterium]